jgi:hypothetical protein
VAGGHFVAYITTKKIMDAEKDFLNVEQNKFKKDYKNMEKALLKQQKEMNSKWTLVMYIKLIMKYKSNLTRGMKKWIKICRGRWLLMKSCRNF